MSGLILLIVLAIWGFASFSLARLIVKPIASSIVKKGVNIALVALIFIAPVADDIVGGVQFRSLCGEGAVIKVDENKAKGKTVYLEDVTTEMIDGFIIPIEKQNWSYRDVNNNELLLTWGYYHAQGGWLSRLIGFPQGSPPYTFNGSCYPKEAFGGKSIFDRLNIKKR